MVDIKRLSENLENATYLLFGKKVRGVERISILNEPEYYIVIGGEEKFIERLGADLKDHIEYLPFGGQNDFFVRNWEIVGEKDIAQHQLISNYVPTSWIHKINEGSRFQILPVMHNLQGCDENFTFILDGSVEIREEFKINTVETNGKNIALYPLNRFKVIGEWII
ncbi:MAG: hypothetical protein ACP5LE_06390 [Thermoplasmata archaeon]